MKSGTMDKLERRKDGFPLSMSGLLMDPRAVKQRRR